MGRWRFGNDQDRHIDGASIRCTYHFYYFDESAPQQQHTLGKLPRRGWKVVRALSAMTTEILFALAAAVVRICARRSQTLAII
jgi:hypothetical protein